MRILSRAIPLFVLGLIAACIGFGRLKVGSVALSQPSATVSTCVKSLDGGSTSTATVCSANVQTNYSPVTANCKVNVTDAGGSSASGTFTWLVSPDCINFGEFDGGVIGAYSVASATGTNGIQIAAALNPNPWACVNVSDSSVIVDAGGLATCVMGVLNVQNIH